MELKNRPYLLLMVLSILVLILLQVFYLNAVYKENKSSLQQETSLLFATTITGMVDSLVWKRASSDGIPLIPVLDSLIDHSRRGVVFRSFDQQFTNDVNDENFHIQVIVDSLGSIKTDSSKNRVIRIVSRDVNLQADSIRRIVRPIILKSDSFPKRQTFEFNFNKELFGTEEVVEVFNQRLQNQGYDLIAGMKKFSPGEKDTLPQNNHALYLEEVNIPFGTSFQAYFEDYRKFLWMKMLPPLIFGILVLALISLSFILLYRNIIRQQRLNMLKNDLISNITHELKTPIATVGVVLEALENFGADQQTETRQEYIQIAKRELKRLNKMSESILSSAASGQKDSPKTRIEFDKILEEQLLSFKPIMKSKGFLFDYKKDKDDYHFRGNQESLAMMIFNLLDNAVKYSQKTKVISVRLLGYQSQIQLEVQDQGIGIPEKYQKEVFEKFVRVPQQDTHDVKGYGLGLAQVYGAVKQHNGKISIKSEIDKGTLFTIQLPKND
jgi:two-component system phosphate regulon sensor histidine kinase PhoR